LSYRFTYGGEEHCACGGSGFLWVTKVSSENKYATYSTIINLSKWPDDLVNALRKYIADDGFGGISLQEYLCHLGVLND
jgi:hypothetical protein